MTLLPGAVIDVAGRTHAFVQDGTDRVVSDPPGGSVDLESIAGEVSTQFAADGDNFFSIKDQLFVSGAVSVPVLVLILLMVRWIW